MKTLLHVFILLCISLNANGQNDKDEAASFFKTIIKSIFDKDCDKLYSMFHDTIAIINPYVDTAFSSKEIVEDRKACEKFEELTSGLTSFQQYLDDYKIVVLSQKEFTSANNKAIINLIDADQTSNLYVYEILQVFNSHYRTGDYLIFGNIHKTDKTKHLDNGLFWLVVRKTNQGWKIFGTRS